MAVFHLSEDSVRTNLNTRLNIIEALQHPQLFGGMPCFQKPESWTAWLAFLKCVYGLPLNVEELALFTRCTGRTTYSPPAGGFQEVVCITGRQSGKTRIAATIASFEAISAKAEADKTETYALMLAQDHRGAVRALLSYAKSPFEIVPSLQGEVLTSTADTIKLANGVNICAYPCRPAAIRGLRARVVVVDELAFFRSTENLPTDVEMLRAVRPALATTNGKLVILSSPYGQSGALWDLHRKHYGNDASSTLVWQASAPEMNPTLSADYLQRMEQDDPEAYKSEVLGEFRSGLSTFLDSESIQACVATGVRERPPTDGISYNAGGDTSGGRSDAFVISVAHTDEAGRAILDAVRTWKAPFNPSDVIAEACAFLKTYRVYSIVADNYAAEFPAEQFRKHGVQYQASTRNRSEIYLELLPLINSERVVLLDHAELLRELRGLERKRGNGGRDKVDHSSRAGSHDDVANSCAIALVEAGIPAITPGVFVFM